MSGGTRLRVAVAVLALVVGTGCAQTKLSPVVPRGPVAERKIPDAVDVTVGRIEVHLDEAVMLWAEDARLDLVAIVRREMKKIQRLLAGPSHATVSISAGSYYTIPDVGIGGFTDPYTGNIRISMDARSGEPLARMLSTWLPITMAHELHHSRRITDGPGYGSTLLDSLIAEGSAEAFVREVYEQAPVIPWVKPMPSEQEAVVWRAARTELDEPDDVNVHQRWFFGGEGLPRWAGYKLGYSIVGAYLHAHPAKTAASLAMIPSSEIYRGSSYAPVHESSSR